LRTDNLYWSFDCFAARCSVTSFILSTPKVRTCLGCTRKALLPPSPDAAMSDRLLLVAARSWVVEELLHATRRCLFCGNRFVTIIWHLIEACCYTMRSRKDTKEIHIAQCLMCYTSGAYRRRWRQPVSTCMMSVNRPPVRWRVGS
jgi:hypothetical protein